MPHLVRTTKQPGPLRTNGSATHCPSPRVERPGTAARARGDAAMGRGHLFPDERLEPVLGEILVLEVERAGEAGLRLIRVVVQRLNVRVLTTSGRDTPRDRRREKREGARHEPSKQREGRAGRRRDRPSRRRRRRASQPQRARGGGGGGASGGGGGGGGSIAWSRRERETTPGERRGRRRGEARKEARGADRDEGTTAAASERDAGRGDGTTTARWRAVRQPRKSNRRTETPRNRRRNTRTFSASSTEMRFAGLN